MSAPQATEFLCGGQRAISCISRLYPLVSRYILLYPLYPLYVVISCYIRTGYREISCPEEGSGLCLWAGLWAVNDQVGTWYCASLKA